MAWIKSLPAEWVTEQGDIVDLRSVPAGPQPIFAGGEPMPDEMRRAQRDYLAWATEIVRYRKQRIAATEGMLPHLDRDRERALEVARCTADPKYFITVWTHVFEYREDQLANFPWYTPKMAGWLPFIPFPFQQDLIDWLWDRVKSSGTAANGAISKSRDMGVTDTCARFALWVFLFITPSHVKFVSRMAELVDQLGNLDSIMERITSHLELAEMNATLPGWLIPQGWNRDDHRRLRLILSPENRNQISGEATTVRTGRGGRAFLIIIDEAAFIPTLRDVLTATQATAPHVIALSSESARHGEAFIKYQDALRTHPEGQVLTLDYWLHPFHDDIWLEQQRERYGEDNQGGFNAEVLRDPYADIGDPMYPEAMQIVPLPEKVDIRDYPGAYLIVGIDPGLADETAIHWLMYNPGGRDVLLESLEITERQPADYIAAILCGADPAKHPEFTFPQRVQDIMDWVREMPEPKYIFGDPYGYVERSKKGDSWYDTMMRWWSLNNPHRNPQTGKRRVYPIRVNWKPEAVKYRDRRQSLMKRLRNMDFNPTEQVHKTILALQRSRWEENPGRRITEMATAPHDMYSHRRSALEYIAVNLDSLEGLTMTPRTKQKGRR